jgi:hypothetical protein
MICKSLYATVNISDHLKDIHAVAFEPHVRMVDKCLGGTCEYQKIQKKFNPVYSPRTSFVYFNAHIAKCNNVTDFIYSRKAILCSFQDVLLAESNSLIQGDELNAYCVTKFIFPEDVDLKSEYCEPEVIRKCNVTGGHNVAAILDFM